VVALFGGHFGGDGRCVPGSISLFRVGGNRFGNEPGAAGPPFRPVRELTLNQWVDDSPGGEALDLDRGELLDLPKEFERLPEPVQTQWLRDQGADLLLLFDRAQGRWGLITVAGNELKLALLPVEKWDTAKHEDLSHAPMAEPDEPVIRQRRDLRVYLLAANRHPRSPSPSTPLAAHTGCCRSRASRRSRIPHGCDSSCCSSKVEAAAGV